MAPAAKKQRVNIEEGGNDEIQAKAAGIIEEIKKKLEASDSGDAAELITSVSCSFLKLKSLQQKVLDQMKKTRTILEKQRKERDIQELKLENLKYQKALNEHSIRECQKLESFELQKLCREELGEPDLDDATAFKKFLGADPNDIEQRATIIAKLNKEVNTRTDLETELKLCQHRAATLKQSLATKRKLLRELPLKLHDVERASQPLQKFCQKSLNATQKLGSKRRTSLDLARSLPKPLYALYYQLQSHLDAMELDPKTKEDLPALEVSNESSAVLLKISIPPVSDEISAVNKSKKSVTIQFEYDQKLGMVMAQANTNNDMVGLIGELFPGDTGEWTGKSDENTAQKLPYHWCNYLAGLHIAPEQHSTAKIRISTGVVVNALIRRVRAMATLSWLLHSISRKSHPFPVHPSMKKELTLAGNSVKLTAWTDQDIDLAPRVHAYQATLKRKSQTLNLTVSIDFGRYPSLPPVWKLSEVESSNSGNSLKADEDTTPALYDGRLAALERKVNYDVHELVSSADEQSCEWILSHQLVEIANGWEEIIENPSTDGST